MAGKSIRISGSFGFNTVSLIKKAAKKEKRSFNSMMEVLLIEAIETRKQQSDVLPRIIKPL